MDQGDKASSLPSKVLFLRLKPSCVALLAQAQLTPTAVSSVSKHLSDIHRILRNEEDRNAALNAGLIQYVFFPLSSLLRRNPPSAIPDQLMEKILKILEILIDPWWWICDVQVWEQLIVLCGTLLGSLDDGKGKFKARDDETKEAAARCLLVLMRDRSEDRGTSVDSIGPARFRTLVSSAKLPIVGQTLSALLLHCASPHLPLQRLSIQMTDILITSYFPDAQVPLVLPGVVSTLCKVAIGREGRSHPLGEVVELALSVLRRIIVFAISDDVCVADGAMRAGGLEDLGPAPLLSAEHTRKGPTPLRTAEWLRGTSTQLHISLNSVIPALIAHPSPLALRGVIELSSTLTKETPRALPQSQALFASALLSLSVHTLPSVSEPARIALLNLLDPPSKVGPQLLHTIFKITSDNMSALSRTLPLHSDARVAHLAGLVTAACRLAPTSKQPGSRQIKKGVASLLGPSGGVEKWGWSLLNVLRFTLPSIAFTSSIVPAILDSDSEAPRDFPDLHMKYLTSRETQLTVSEMFHSLGQSGGDEALYSVEWFTKVSGHGRGHRENAALWCAVHILRGIEESSIRAKSNRRLEKIAKWIAKLISESWDRDEFDDEPSSQDEGVDHGLLIEHRKGLSPLQTLLDTSKSRGLSVDDDLQPVIHRMLSLQLLSVTATILNTGFASLLLHTLYPILHALVSDSASLSSTALVVLQCVSSATGYAAASNLLLANFDYALSSITRHLTRRYLDLQAGKALIMLVRMVGKDVVDLARDVVEVCFDRLDEFHGYQAVVDGMVQVLFEVVKVVKDDYTTTPSKDIGGSSRRYKEDKMETFEDWFVHRKSIPSQPTEQTSAERTNPPSTAADDTRPVQDNAEDEEETPLTSTQQLTKQIVDRSLYFLTHASPVIRARILSLIAASVPTLSSKESSILGAVHKAWPFIINRLQDPEPFVVVEATKLVEALVAGLGDYMNRRVWEDVWPKFKLMLAALDDIKHRNIIPRTASFVRPEAYYAVTSQMHISMTRTMASANHHIELTDAVAWDVALSFRRFLAVEGSSELQSATVGLYRALGEKNPDAVWLVLCGTIGRDPLSQTDTDFPTFLLRKEWDIADNAVDVLNYLDEERILP